MTKVLTIIPARGSSKGIPEKNIKLLGGKPLIRYSIDFAKQFEIFNKIVVSTEDKKIADIAINCSVDVIERPIELAQDTTPTIDVIKHVLSLQSISDEKYDAVCILQPTTPFREINDIELAFKTFELKDSDSLISVRIVPTEFNPFWVFIPDQNDILKVSTGNLNIISRRQELPVAYYRDGSIYITKVNTILNENSLFGKSISYIVSKNKHFVNIDTMEDWEKAEQIVKLFYK